MDNKDYVLEKINQYFRSLALESHNKLLGKDSFQYYQTPLDFIEKALSLIEKREGDFKNKKFLDIGSGAGYICGIAARMGLQAEGIEIIPELYNISKQIFPEVRFHNMNIRDFNNYENYDIVFYWLPFHNSILLQEFKKKIEDETRVGSYIIVVEEEVQNAGKDDRFLKIDYNSNINGIESKIWQKIK